jgi:hypothetical protein
MPRTALYILIGLSAWLLGVCWALSSPVGSSPDDDFHLTSIYCATGDPVLCRDVDGAGSGTAVEVPAAVVSSVCFAFRSEESGACTDDFTDVPKTRTERFNAAGDYPPTFYAAMSVFAGSDVARSVLVMRIVAMTVALGVLGLAAATSPRMRDSQLLAWSLVSIPLGMFLFTSTNPSGWGVAGVAATWPAAYTILERAKRGERFWAPAAAGVLAAVLATSRGDTAGMAAGVLGLVILAYVRSRRQLAAAGLLLVQAAVLSMVFLSVGSGPITTGQEQQQTGGATWRNLTQLPDLWADVFGVKQGLGWLDTRMPGIVWLPALVAVAGIAFVGIRKLKIPRALVLSGVVFAMTAYPLVTLHFSDPADGFWFQPRYVLPLIAVLISIAVAPVDGPWRLTRPQRWFLAACGSVAASLAVHVQLRRYVTGVDITSFNLNAGAEWSYLDGSPMTLWLLASVSAVVLFIGLTALFREPSRLAAASAGSDQAPAEGGGPVTDPVAAR